MKKSIIISIVIAVLLLSSCLMGILYGSKIKSYKPDEQNDASKQEITIEQETNELLMVDETDENIIGYITIEKIGLEKAPIADGTDLTTINSYVGHFKESSYLDGNVCLCSHNRGGKGAYFGRLKELQQGDVITYITKYETKQYEVKEVKTIEETDFSVIEGTEENQITLLTCVENVENLRLCVIGTQK
ncbi:class D sortase [bacterium]|nr:class D sortase [bacterium]